MSQQAFRDLNAAHFGYRLLKGNAKQKPITKEDIARGDARRKLEDIQMAKQLGISLKDLQ